MAQTEAVLKSTGGQANVTAEQVVNLANSLRDMTGIDDEAIQASSNLLLTFRDVHNEVGKGNDIFNQAQVAILNMATALNQGAIPSTDQLQSATIQLGKALNDPIQGLTALRRVGVSFTEAQVEQIKAMQEAGNLMGAQKLILGELTKEFGGAAKAAGSTFAGQLSILRSQFEDVLESVGKGLLPILKQLTTVLQGLVPILKLVADNLGGVLGVLLGFAALKYLPGLLLNIAVGLEAIGATSLANGVLSVAASIASVGASLALAAPAAVAFAAAFAGLTAAVAAWDPLGLVDDTNKLRDSMTIQTEAFGDSEVVLGRVAVSQNLLKHSTKETTQSVDEMKQKADLATAGITNLAGGLTEAAVSATQAGHSFGRVGRDIRNAIVDELSQVPGTITNVKQAFDITPQELVRLTNTWRQIGKRIANDLEVIGESDLKPAVRNAILQLPPEMRDAWVQGTNAQRAKIEEQLQKFLNIQDQVPRLARQAQQGMVPVGRSLVDGLTSGADAQAGILNAKMTSIVAAAIAAARRAADAHSPSKKMIQLGHDLMEGLKDGIGDKDREVAQKLTESIGKMLDAAKSALSDFRSKMRDFAGGIRGGFSSFSDLIGAFGEGEVPVQDVLSAQLGGAQTFADVLDALKRQGASKGLLSQIAGAGPEGLGFAQALLQGGPALVEQASQTLAGINKIATSTGKALSEDFFGNKMDRLQNRADRIAELLAEANRLLRGEGGDVVLQIDGQTFARITRDQLLKLGKHNVTAGIT